MRIDERDRVVCVWRIRRVAERAEQLGLLAVQDVTDPPDEPEASEARVDERLRARPVHETARDDGSTRAGPSQPRHLNLVAHIILRMDLVDRTAALRY